MAIDDPTFGCGDKTCDASTCPDPDQGTLVCNAGKCVVGVCGSGSKQCDDKCVPPDRNHGCNDPNSCDACSTIEVCDVFQRPGCLCQADDVCAGRKCGTYKTRCGTNVTCMDQCKAPAKVCDDGACVECITPDDCEQPGRNPCAVATCKSHQCGFAVASPGTSCRGGTCSATFPGVCERKPIKIDGYSIDAAEVTRGEYLIFIASTDNGVVSGQPPACSWNDTIIPNSIDQDPPMADYDIPVGNIDWCDAYAYCDWAGKHLCGKIGGGPNLFADYNDATKSQWMHACQGPSGNAYAYGNTFDPNRCAGPDAGGPEDVESRTTCVGGYPGLYDMSANIEEWEDSCKAATGATDGCRARGGSFFPNNVPQDAVRCDTNFSYMRSFHGNEMGIRCCGG